jgi:hypothetical protein
MTLPLEARLEPLLHRPRNRFTALFSPHLAGQLQPRLQIGSRAGVAGIQQNQVTSITAHLPSCVVSG